MKLIFTMMLAGISALSGPSTPAIPDGEPRALSLPSNTNQLFEHNKVWNIHLSFSEENWEKVKPVWKGGFGPGGVLAPAFIADADKNGDAVLSRKEFINLGDHYYKTWSGNNKEFLEKQQVTDGIAELAQELNKGKLVLSGVEGERNGIASVLGVEFPDSYVDLEFEGMSMKSVSVRHKGNGTFMEGNKVGKLSFKLDINDDNPGRNLAGAVKLNLHSCITDATYMNEVLAYRLFRDAGVPAPRTSYAQVDLSTPETEGRNYKSLYSLVENVDKRFLYSNFGTKGGALFKPVTPFLFSYLGDNWSDYEQIYDPKTKVSQDEIDRLMEVCQLVSSSDDQEFEKHFAEYFDLDNLARFLAVTVLISDLDGIIGPGQNFYLYLQPGSNKFVFIPWDQDHSFGQMKRSQEHREKLSIRRPWDQGNVFLDRLFEVESFYALYTLYIKSFSENLFTPERLSRQVDELALILDEAVMLESEERYEKFKTLTRWDPAGDTLILPGELASNDPGMMGSDVGVKPIKGFVVRRSASVKAQLEGRSDGIEDTFPMSLGKLVRRMDFSGVFMNAMDLDQDDQLSRKEFDQGFASWSDEWDLDGSSDYSATELKIGVNKALAEQ